MALVRSLAGERRAIVIKGGGALERWARIQTVLFDTTARWHPAGHGSRRLTPTLGRRGNGHPSPPPRWRRVRRIRPLPRCSRRPPGTAPLSAPPDGL